METFTFSFLSSSLYLGFIIKNVAIITSAVSIYDKAPVTPYFILLPITETIATPNSGIEFAKHAANILILNGTDDDNKLEIAKQGLTSLGYTIKTTKTNKTEKTIIINQTNVSDEEISGIKENLQKGIIKTNTTKNDTYDVKIILGTDFNG